MLGKTAPNLRLERLTMPNQRHDPNRREIIKGIGLGIFGLAAGGLSVRPSKVFAQASSGEIRQSAKRQLWTKPTEPARVSLIKGSDRREIVFQALKNIEDEVLASIGKKKRILVKPNFVVTNTELCATHVDAVRAILDFLKPRCKQEIIVGESTASRDGTFEGYKNYGYMPLEKEYGIKLVDLNRESFQWRYAIGKGNRPMPLRIISMFLDPDVYVISAAKIKTHDRVLATLSLKNVLLAAPVNDYQNSDKRQMHSDNAFTRDTLLHYNMFQLAQEIYPDLGVIDGFVAMEGDGPVNGTPVEAKLALASIDPLAMDVLTTKLMGFDPSQIMYLAAMTEAGMGQGDLSKVQVLGTPADQCQYHFKPARQLVGAYGLG